MGRSISTDNLGNIICRDVSSRVNDVEGKEVELYLVDGASTSSTDVLLDGAWSRAITQRQPETHQITLGPLV